MAKKVILADKELTGYLGKAEDALIGAVKLFSDHPTLERRVGYYSRLVKAQEAITGLLREELVRERGPHRSGKGGKGRPSRPRGSTRRSK